VAYAEKKTLPRVSVGVSQSVRVATIDKVKNGSAQIQEDCLQCQVGFSWQ
jgi:hypothetical protein